MRERERTVDRSPVWRIARLWLPRWFRARYGQAMLESHVERVGSGGAHGLAFWAALLWDVLATGFAVRVDAVRGEGRLRTVARWMLEEMGQSIRRLRRQPGFLVAVAVTLGLGMGANVTMFSILDRLFLKAPAGVNGADRVRGLYVWGKGPFRQEPGYARSLTYPDYEALSQTSAFEAIAGHAQLDMTLGHGERSERVKTELATSSYFRVLGLKPAIGRFYTEAEDAIGAKTPVAVLSWSFWQRRFGGDPAAIGKAIALGKATYTVVGVAPRNFGGTGLAPTEIWIPLRTAGAIEYFPGFETARQWYWFGALVRLPRGGDARAAATEATSRYRAARNDQPTFDRESRVELASIIPGRAPEPTREARVTRGLGVVAFLVLLIACANVTNLLLARGIRQRRQHAVQSALGMSRGRLITQILVDTLAMAAVGGAVALLLAGVLGPVLIRLLIPDAGNVIAVGNRTVAVTTLLVVLATLLTGMLPSWRSSRVDELEALRSRGSTPGVTLLRRTLMGLQAALSVVLLVGAGLFVRSLMRAESLDLGLADNVLTVSFEMENGESMSADHTRAVYAALERVRSDPGVASAAATSMPPFSGIWALLVDIPGPDSIPVGPDGPQFYAATGDYFETMGIPVLRGRGLTDPDDRDGAKPVAVVSESMARAVWPAGDALGQCLLFPDPNPDSGAESTVSGANPPPAGQSAPTTPSCTEVVGVVGDHLPSVTAAAAIQTYYLAPHHAAADLAAHSIVVRPRGDPASLIPHLRAVVRQASPDIRYTSVGLLSDRVRGQLVAWRLGATLLSLFGVLALLVAAAGIYSVVAFEVAQRRFELSVRKALGAPGGRLLRTVAGRSVFATALGVAAGLAAALALGRLTEAVLFHVSARDPLTYLTVSATLLLAAVLAAAGPALRAIRADPALALRQDV